MPSGLTAGKIYYLRNETASTIHVLASDASSDINPVDIGAGGPVLVRFPAAADTAVQSGYEFTGDNVAIQWYSGKSRDNIIRGSSAWTYAQITSAKNDYALHLCDEHRLSSDASRAITGIDQEGVTSEVDQTAHGRRIRLFNVGAQDIVLQDDAGAGSLAENEIACHTNADITLAAGESIELEYDGVSLLWRTIGN
jgi:hypothetical protein